MTDFISYIEKVVTFAKIAETDLVIVSSSNQYFYTIDLNVAFYVNIVIEKPLLLATASLNYIDINVHC